MTFANEMKDFVTAFGAVSNILGTKTSREAERLDNEYRRATIDYTRARTDEILGKGHDLDDFLTTNPYDPAPFDYDADEDGGGGGPGAPTEAEASPGTAAVITSSGGSTFDRDLTPPARPATKTAAVSDSDLGGATGADTLSFGSGGQDKFTGRRTSAISRPSMTPEQQARASRRRAGEGVSDLRGGGGLSGFQERIVDRTGGFSSLQPKTRNILAAMNTAAKAMGVKLVLTAGGGPGHRSHSRGTEADITGFYNGKKWTPAMRARIAAAGASVGANRFGLYPGGSLHVGVAGEGRPSAVWGANGIVSGPSARQFQNPADRAFLADFSAGKLYGGGGRRSVFDISTEATGEDYDPLSRARNAIAYIESRGSGDYQAVNSSSGALGRYQIMPKNLPSWSQEALGRRVSAKEFLANPDIQNQIFDYQFGKLFEKYGNLQDAASAWYSGGPLRDRPVAQGYVNKFNRAMGLVGDEGGGGDVSGAAGSGPSLRGGTLDDEMSALAAGYPEARTKDDAYTPATGEEYPESRNKDDVAALDPRIHTVVKGDTLWDIAKENNLDTYMQIVEANPAIIENPDLIYPGEQFVIPPMAGIGGVADASVPDPNLRPGAGSPVTPLEERNPMTSSTGAVMPDEANPMASSTGNTMAVGPNVRPAGGPGGLPPTSSTPRTEKDPAEELQLAYARRDQIEQSDNPPAVKAAWRRAINVKIAQLETELGIGLPKGRAPFPTEDYDPNQFNQHSTPFTNPGGPITARPGEAGALPAEDNPGGPITARPMPGGPGAMPEEPYVPGEESYTPRDDVDVNQALKLAYARRDQLAGSDMDSMAKAVRIRAINAKIADLEERGGRLPAESGPGPGAGPRMRGGKYDTMMVTPMSYTPEEGAVPDVPLPSARPERGADIPIPPQRPEEGPVDPDKLAGATSDDDLAGGTRGERLGPAQQSIADVTNQWNISPTGHVVRPDGRESPDNSFSSGRKAARAGSNWLSELFFPGGDEAVDLEEDATPDDDQEDNVSRYLAGAHAAKKSDMAKIHAVVDAWAEKNGIELTASERNMRALGIMFDYWLSRGEPDKAQAVAGAMLQYHRGMYARYSAIAKAALEAGDNDKAVEAAVAAYSNIPDGRDITVEGNQETGYTFSYINEETGKTISKKVLTPQEMTGMIMNMAPGDVDKFLVKAAGADEIPEPSAAFSAAMDRLNNTPPGERPVFDAEAAAYFDSGESSLYAAAFGDLMEQWKSPERKIAADAELLLGDDAGAVAAEPAAPAAPADTTAAAAPEEGVGDAGAVPIEEAPAEPVAPVAAVNETALTSKVSAAPTETPTTPAAPVRGFPSGIKVDDAHPTVFQPGDNKDFGMGPPPEINLPKYLKLQSDRGAEAMKIQLDADTRRYAAEHDRRLEEFNLWRSNPTAPVATNVGPPTERSMMGGALEIGGPSGVDEADQDLQKAKRAAQLGMPYINPRLPIVANQPGDVGDEWVPDFGPGPDDGLGGYGMPLKPFVDPARKFNQPKYIVDDLEAKNAIAVQVWEAQREVNKNIYDARVAGQKPAVKAITDASEIETIRTNVHAYIESIARPNDGRDPSGLTQEEVNHLLQNEGTVATAVQTMMEQGIQPAMAYDMATTMISVNQKTPTMPNWRAYRNPDDAGTVLVQVLNGNGEPEGQVLWLKERDFLPLQRTWSREAQRVTAAGYTPEKNLTETVAGAVGEAAGAVGEVAQNPSRFSRYVAEPITEWIDEILGSGQHSPGEVRPPVDTNPNLWPPTGN